MEAKSVVCGDVLSFRLPSDTPVEILDYLTALKRKVGRNYSQNLAQMLLIGARGMVHKQLHIELPETMSQEQQEWLNSSISQRMLQMLIVNFLENPSLSLDGSEAVFSGAFDARGAILQPPTQPKPYESDLQKILAASLLR